jgi:hypothetical protein
MCTFSKQMLAVNPDPRIHPTQKQISEPGLDSAFLVVEFDKAILLTIRRGCRYFRHGETLDRDEIASGLNFYSGCHL